MSLSRHLPAVRRRIGRRLINLSLTNGRLPISYERRGLLAPFVDGSLGLCALPLDHTPANKKPALGGLLLCWEELGATSISVGCF